MRLLVVSDLHGDLDSVRITIDRFEADGLLGYGDWGDPDQDVAGFAGRIASPGPVDVLLTHGCPIGLADQTPKGTRGGQRCFPRSRRGRSKPSARSTPGSKAQAARASKIGENRRPDLGQGERSQIGDGGRRGIARTARTASAIR